MTAIEIATPHPTRLGSQRGAEKLYAVESREQSASYPLRGRAPELERAIEVLRRTRISGQGSIVLVLGESGIGKTAFLESIADHARTMDFRVAAGKAEQFNQIAPLAPLPLALRAGSTPLLSRDEFTALAPLYQQQLWLVDRLAGILEERASESPLLIAVDDVQWVDPFSVFAMRVMPSHLAGFPIVWLVTTRPNPALAANEIIAAVSAELAVERIHLGPLKPEAIEELVLDRYGASPSGRIRELLRGAAGYPFLAVELLDGYARDENVATVLDERTDLRIPKSTSTQLPNALILGVRSRLESLSDETSRLVRVASVLGRSFAIQDVAAVLNIKPWTRIIPWTESAVRAGILQDDGDGIAFRHDLLRQAVYEDIPQSIRAELHRATAERYVASGREPLDAAPHVPLYATSGDREAVEILRRSARTVASTMPTVAAELIEGAFSLIRPADRAWVEVGAEAIAILAAAHRISDAMAIADRLLTANIEPEAAAQIRTRVARMLGQEGHINEMRLHLDEAERLRISETSRAEVLALRALASSAEDDWMCAARIGEGALSEARRLGNRTAEADALRALAEGSRNDGRHELALEYFHTLRALIETTSPANESIALQLLDDYDASRTLLREAHRRGDDRCDNSRALETAFAEMWHDYSLGLLDETETDGNTLLQLAADLQEHRYRYEARIVLSRVAQLRGDLAGARAHLASAVTESAGADDARMLTQAMSAWLSASEGDYAAALTSLRLVVRSTHFPRHRYFWQPAWLVAATRIAMLGHDPEVAGEVALMARGLAERNPNVATIQGIAAHAEGLARGDLGLLETAVTSLNNSPRQLVRADAAVDLGTMELSAGRRDAGIATLDMAWEIFNRVGARGEALKVQGRLRNAGVRRRRWAATTARPLQGWAALTQTEQRVSQLIADGHTNRSAAAELILSPNTVATHLRSIFGKLEVNSRSQLTRVAMAQRA